MPRPAGPDARSTVRQSISRAQTEIEKVCAHRYYAFRGTSVPALRLIGAAEEWFSSQEITVKTENVPYVLPEIIQLHRASILAMLIEEARLNGRLLFDGLAVRLRDYRVEVPNAATERKHIELTLGPLGYHDYAVARYVSDAALRDKGSYRLSDFLNLKDIAAGSKVTHSSLSNIVDTATTLITSDGQLIYTQRSQVVHGRDTWYTSSVAEGISGTLDKVFSKDVKRILPVPFETVLRGLEEEISPQIKDMVTHQGFQSMICLGMSFDLEGFHPDLLFLIPLSMTFREVQQLCQEYPGKDFFEGKMIGSDIDQGTDEVLATLRRRQWTPGGAASVIRSLEFLNAVSVRMGTSQFKNLIPGLISGTALK